jgi:hypothetical protein
MFVRYHEHAYSQHKYAISYKQKRMELLSCFVQWENVDMGTDRTVIMVGNKLDLVRKRRVKTEGKDITEL